MRSPTAVALRAPFGASVPKFLDFPLPQGSKLRLAEKFDLFSGYLRMLLALVEVVRVQAGDRS